MTHCIRNSVMTAVAIFSASYYAYAIAQPAPERTIRLGNCVPEEHPTGQGTNKFAEAMTRISGSKIKTKVHHACQLGSDSQMIAAARGGVQDMAIVSTASIATIVKEFQLFDLPFLFQSEKEVDMVLDGKLGQSLLDLTQSKNMIGLCYWENGFRQVTNSKRAVSTVDDLSGLKIRVMPNPVYIETFKALGANAVPMPMTELFSALETKAMDGQENPIANIHANKLNEVQKYLSLTNHAYAPLVILVSKIFWDKLGENEREQMRKGCYEARDYQRSLNRAMATSLLDNLKTQGMTITKVSAVEIDKMRARTKPIIEHYKQEIGASTVDQAQREIAAIRDQ